MTEREQGQIADVLHEIRRHTGFLERLDERTATQGVQVKAMSETLSAAIVKSEKNANKIGFVFLAAPFLLAGVFGLIFFLHK